MVEGERSQFGEADFANSKPEAAPSGEPFSGGVTPTEPLAPPEVVATEANPTVPEEYPASASKPPLEISSISDKEIVSLPPEQLQEAVESIFNANNPHEDV